MSATPLAHAIARKIVLDQDATGGRAPAYLAVTQAEYDALVEEMKLLQKKLARPIPRSVDGLMIMGVPVRVVGK
jgi:hypothetical protein